MLKQGMRNREWIRLNEYVFVAIIWIRSRHETISISGPYVVCCPAITYTFRLGPSATWNHDQDASMSQQIFSTELNLFDYFSSKFFKWLFSFVSLIFNKRFRCLQFGQFVTNLQFLFCISKQISCVACTCRLYVFCFFFFF